MYDECHLDVRVFIHEAVSVCGVLLLTGQDHVRGSTTAHGERRVSPIIIINLNPLVTDRRGHFELGVQAVTSLEVQVAHSHLNVRGNLDSAGAGAELDLVDEVPERVAVYVQVGAQRVALLARLTHRDGTSSRRGVHILT